jgi:subtilisin family serine protease
MTALNYGSKKTLTLLFIIFSLVLMGCKKPTHISQEPIPPEEEIPVQSEQSSEKDFVQPEPEQPEQQPPGKDFVQPEPEQPNPEQRPEQPGPQPEPEQRPEPEQFGPEQPNPEQPIPELEQKPELEPQPEAGQQIELGNDLEPISDPLFPYQWYLKSTGQTSFASESGTPGQDINWLPVYRKGKTGSGVIVAVVDSGLEIAHEDLRDNVIDGGSWDFVGRDTDPTKSSSLGDHGTAVAGIIAARGDNGIGVIGIASEASLKGFNLTSSNQSAYKKIAALGGSTDRPNSSNVDIFNQSYSFYYTYDFAINRWVKSQYAIGVATLRGGKGAIYVKAAGNGFVHFADAVCTNANRFHVSCQNASMDNINTLPYNIVVGAVNADGLHSSYSTAGSALWISAPGGEYGGHLNFRQFNDSKFGKPAIVTTDQSGCTKGYSPNNPYNSFQDGSNLLNIDCNYTSTFNGTSAATPMISGVAALILEENSDLSWRDVKHILATTARKVDPDHHGVKIGNYQLDSGWVTNAAGYKFSNYYGFGVVDAGAAVTMAGKYSVDLGRWTSGGWFRSQALDIVIPDNSFVGINDSIKYHRELTIEAVQISVNITHTFTGDIGIELTSPQGTKSIMFTVYNGFGRDNNLTNMVIASNAFYGESSLGDWKIKVLDIGVGDVGKLKSWKIKVYGH